LGEHGSSEGAYQHRNVVVGGAIRFLRDVDPQKPAHGMYALDDLLCATYARDRRALVTLLVFAGTSFFLAVLSAFGVLSQRVRERSREIGIRMVMGQTRPA
jgi:ABC-type antimicrobial peptide transport system permease subunit